jgi:hypothetical protein
MGSQFTIETILLAGICWILVETAWNSSIMDAIQVKTLKLSKKMLEKLKNKVFGDSQTEKFDIGEIVKWPGWDIQENNVTRNYKYGVLLSIYTGVLDRRDIKIAEILPFGAKKPIKISLILVKKSDLED